jgi:multiple sugar transport system substrate-binding protein
MLRWRTNPSNEAEIALDRSINRIVNQEIEGFTFIYDPGGDQKASYYDQLKVEIAAGSAPDVFWLSGTDLADFATRGMILDLQAFAEADTDYVAENFYAGPMQHLTYDPKTGQTGQRLWGLPRDVSTFVLYLNLDLIEQGLMPDPRQLAKEGKWDWHAFLQVAEAVNHLGDNVYGYGQNAWWATYGYWLQAAGGDFYYPDRSACLLDSQKALYGLDFQRAMYQDSQVAVPYHEDAAGHFLVGGLGMYLDGRGAAKVVDASVHFNWDIVKLPDGPEGPSHWLLWGAYVVSRNTKHPQAAYQLVRTFTRSDIQLKMSELDAKIPSRVNNHVTRHFLTLRPPKNNGAYLQALTDNAQTMGPLWNGSWFHYLAIMDHLLSRVLTGELTLEDYASAICNEANSAFFR